MTKMNGIISVYKPKGWTSHDVVDKIRSITKVKRVGHAGTLDPLAEGVLVVGIGREATKKLNVELQKEKEYDAIIKLGETSITGDEEGEKTTINVQSIPAKKEIEEALKQFTGTIMQTPPQYSSIKIKGKSAYKYARRGQKVLIEPREVHVKKIELVNYTWPFLEIRVVSGPGVYIRGLAQDIGEKLQTGGYLFKLIRTRVGEYSVNKSIHAEQLTSDLFQGIV